MTLDSLGVFIKNYINYLQETKSLKNAGRVTFKIKHSKISKSIYVRLSVSAGDKVFTKTLRFSDHECAPSNKPIQRKYKGVLVNSEGSISKRMKKHIETMLRKEITRLIYGANLNVVYSFKADA